MGRPKPGNTIWLTLSALIPVVCTLKFIFFAFYLLIASGVPKEPNPDAVAFIKSSNPLFTLLKEVRGVNPALVTHYLKR
jgi:hypothetical protein